MPPIVANGGTFGIPSAYVQVLELPTKSMEIKETYHIPPGYAKLPNDSIMVDTDNFITFVQNLQCP